MPTSRRRHAVTETPSVEAALGELRRVMGDARIEMSELVILGAHAKLAELRAQQDDVVERRRSLADLIRAGGISVDPVAAVEVRQKGWIHG